MFNRTNQDTTVVAACTLTPSERSGSLTRPSRGSPTAAPLTWPCREAGVCCPYMPESSPRQSSGREQRTPCFTVRALLLSFPIFARTNEIRSVTPTLWEAAALGDVEHVSRACLESSRTSKDTTGKPWACPGVNHKTPGLGFTPLHACMAGLAAVTGGVDVSRPCTPPRPRGQANGPSRPSLYARLARGYGRPTRRCGDKNNKNHQKNEVISGSPSLLTGNYLGVCRTLLSAAADVQALDARCRTPLALAAAAGSLEVRAVPKTGVQALPNVAT